MDEWEGNSTSPRGWPHHRTVVAATKTMESSYENEVVVIDWPVKFLFLLIDLEAVNNIDTSRGTTRYE